MARLTASSAPAAARKLIKRATFTRRELSTLSKSEENNIQGAREQRERMAEKFARDTLEAECVTDETFKVAARFDRVALCLKHPSTPATDPLAKLAAMAARMGLPAPRVAALAELAGYAARTARDSAQRAQDRLDGASDDIEATNALGKMLDALPKYGWDVKHPRIAPLRDTYLHHTRALGRQRKER